MKQMKPQFSPLACTGACEWLGAQVGMESQSTIRKDF